MKPWGSLELDNAMFTAKVTNNIRVITQLGGTPGFEVSAFTCGRLMSSLGKQLATSPTVRNVTAVEHMQSRATRMHNDKYENIRRSYFNIPHTNSYLK